MSQHVFSVRLNLIVFGALMALLTLTVAVSYLDMGSLGLPIAMGIAVIKALLIIAYFMHMRYASGLSRVFAGAAVFWLAIMIALTLNDYMSRGYLLIPGK